ncbi:MAG: TlpA disulfide reductase family protein [Planctomycetota bacterium]
MRRNRRLAFVLTASVLGFLSAGCSDEPSPSHPAAPPAMVPKNAGTEGPLGSEVGEAIKPAGTAEPASSDGSHPDFAGDVAVRVVDESEFARVLESYRGKVVLVDVWATWCPPCLELFPHTVELTRRFADRGLVVISLSIDDPEDEASVLESLASKGATFDNFISRYGGSAKSLDLVDLKDGVLSIFRIYDRGGKVHKTLLSSEDPIAAEDVDRAVEEALGPLGGPSTPQ